MTDNQQLITEKLFTQSFIAFAIRQGGLEHDRIKSLSVVDVELGQIKEIYHYDTNPENLSDVWFDLIDCFKKHEYAVAYNLATHRSNLEKSLIAVGIQPPTIKYVCAYNWANTVSNDSDNLGINTIYSGAESIVELIAELTNLSGLTVAERYNQIHTNGRTGTSNFFRSGTPDADVDGLKWLNELSEVDTFWHNKTVVITGDFLCHPDRNKLTELVKERGAKVSSAISGKTNVVLVGKGAGPSKLNKVRELMASGKEVVCISEELLKQII